MVDTAVGMEFSNGFALDGCISPQFVGIIGNFDGAARTFRRETPVFKFDSVICSELVYVLLLQGFRLCGLPDALDIIGIGHLVYRTGIVAYRRQRIDLRNGVFSFFQRDFQATHPVDVYIHFSRFPIWRYGVVHVARLGTD